MLHYVGLDVALETTQVCVIDRKGKTVAEALIESHPEPLAQYLFSLELEFDRIGLETGSLSQWLHTGLTKSGLPVHCIDARAISGYLNLKKTNKNDRNDAQSIAKAMLYETEHLVHVKSVESRQQRSLLICRKHIQVQMLATQGAVRGILHSHGLKPKKVSHGKWEAHIRELIEGDAILQEILEPMFQCVRTQIAQLGISDRHIGRTARSNPICRLLMSTPGVGVITALSFKSAIDEPSRFSNSETVGAYLGLTPQQHQSGKVDRKGRISKAGDVSLRTVLVEAAHLLLTRGKPSWLKDWALKIKQRRNKFIAAIALARKLAVIMHRMWLDNTEFCWDREPKPVLRLAA